MFATEIERVEGTHVLNYAKYIRISIQHFFFGIKVLFEWSLKDGEGMSLLEYGERGRVREEGRGSSLDLVERNPKIMNVLKYSLVGLPCHHQIKCKFRHFKLFIIDYIFN